MALTLPRQLLYGFIIFTLVIVGGVVLLGMFFDADPNLDSTEYERFNRTFNKLEEVTDGVDSLKAGTEVEPDFGVLGVLNSLIMSSWNTLRLLLTSFSFIGAAIVGLSTYFGIPVWVTALVSLLFTVLVVFSIISAILQREI